MTAWNPRKDGTGRDRRRQKEHRAALADESGFSLVELLVVLGIIALLATLVGPRVIGYFGKAKSETAQIQVRNLHTALDLYFLDVGSYPAAETGLQALVSNASSTPGWSGPYVKIKESLVDPWGRPYVYKTPGEHDAFDVASYGRDGAPGGEGEDRDVINW